MPDSFEVLEQEQIESLANSDNNLDGKYEPRENPEERTNQWELSHKGKVVPIKDRNTRSDKRDLWSDPKDYWGKEKSSQRKEYISDLNFSDEVGGVEEPQVSENLWDDYFDVNKDEETSEPNWKKYLGGYEEESRNIPVEELSEEEIDRSRREKYFGSKG